MLPPDSGTVRHMNGMPKVTQTIINKPKKLQFCLNFLQLKKIINCFQKKLFPTDFPFF